MANREPKIGDYLVTKDRRIFVITDIHVDTVGTYYDVKFDNSRDMMAYQSIRSIPRNLFRHMGKVIPGEDMTKAMKILYG